MAKKTDPDYIQNLRLTKSLLVVTSLQKRRDVEAKVLIENYPVPLEFQPGSRWAYSAQAGFDTLVLVAEVASGHFWVSRSAW